MNAGEVQQENLSKAVEQFQAILKTDPNDTYSLLWLARLYRFQNKHAEAEKVLRAGFIAHDADNGPGARTAKPVLIDARARSQEAIELLTRAAGDYRVARYLRPAGRRLRAGQGLSEGGSRPTSKPLTGIRMIRAIATDSRRRCCPRTNTRRPSSNSTSSRSWSLGTSENFLRAAQLYRRLGEFDEAAASLARAKQLAPGSLRDSRTTKRCWTRTRDTTTKR